MSIPINSLLNVRLTMTYRELDFSSLLRACMGKHQPSFEIAGLLMRDDRLYPFSTDTKVLSTVFELAVRPLVHEIAGEHNLQVHEPSQQNFYPDFTLMRDTHDKNKSAIDVKSTYRHFKSDGSWTASFTLGSYTSYLRNETKNIAFPYSDYQSEYVIGFVYSRTVPVNDTDVYSLDNRDAAPCPFTNVEYFVQEKYRIAGWTPGSGNTTNIGSIVGSSISDFAEGCGPFAKLGEEVFKDYWRNYTQRRQGRPYSNLEEYLEWKQERRP